MKALFLTVSALAIMITGCSDIKEDNADSPEKAFEKSPAVSDKNGLSTAPVIKPSPVIKPWGYPLDALDRSTRPQDDLYQFANGGWIAETVIPDDRSAVGFSQIMRDRNEIRIKTIIDELVSSSVVKGSDQQKIRDLFQSYMDTDTINEAGLEPLAPFLAKVDAAKNADQIARIMADPLMSAPGPFAGFVSIDSKNPERYTVYLSHSGLALPDRSYYLRDSERLETVRQSYQDYLQKAFVRLGESEPEKAAKSVYDLEKKIAEIHWDRVKQRNADLTYNPVSRTGLKDLAPGFPWDAFMEARGFGDRDDFIIRQLDAFAELARLFKNTAVETWQRYLKVRLLSAHSRYLSDEISQESFEFFGKVLGGQQQQRPREVRAIQFVNGALDQAVGKIYIERFFPETSKQLVTDMYQNIKAELSSRIETLSWMSDTTKVKAQEKLTKLQAKIAYPDQWIDYSGVSIADTGLMDNIIALRQFDHQQSLKDLSGTVDKLRWVTSPQTVNAFYNPTRNEIFIPAGYIQSPLFDPNADSALNYGALGSIIGHEIGHGFDDQGSKYDGDGNLRSWWTVEDRAAFDKAGDALAAQFDQYETLPGLTVNGRQTLGENIGDLAGMHLAFNAWQRSLGGEEAPVLDGFTGEQRFFLGRAQGRRYKRTEQSMRRRLLSAPHSPMYLRVNGMAINMDEFYEAFDVVEGDAMYLAPEKRVKIW